MSRTFGLEDRLVPSAGEVFRFFSVTGPPGWRCRLGQDEGRNHARQLPTSAAATERPVTARVVDARA
jgi:hypothetical protein